MFFNYSGYDHKTPNEIVPDQFYSIAKYKCEEGYISESLSLFCSENEWVGKYPECLKSTNDYDSEYDEIEVKLCSDAKKCEHICVVTENGAEICQCHQGFLLDPKTNLCQDIDECKSETNGGCDQICINKPGTALCQCRSGYTLTEDGKSNRTRLSTIVEILKI